MFLTHDTVVWCLLTAGITIIVMAGIFEWMLAKDLVERGVAELKAKPERCSCGRGNVGEPGHDGYEDVLDVHFASAIKD